MCAATLVLAVMTAACVAREGRKGRRGWVTRGSISPAATASTTAAVRGCAASEHGICAGASSPKDYNNADWG